LDLKNELDRRKLKVDEYLTGIFDPIKQMNLRAAMLHLPGAGGKRLRPICTMLACELVGGDVEDVMPMAIAIELIHNFTLVHDDIMDEDDLRRGLPTVHEAFDTPTAINAGDGLYSHALDIFTRCNCSDKVFRRLVKELAITVRAIGEGQQDDMDFERRNDVTIEEYYAMIENKTAKIFELALRGGALIAGADDEKVRALGEFGKYYGISFQLSDDYLDLMARSRELGKPARSDLKKNKKTLIIVKALHKASLKDKLVLKSILGNPLATDEELDVAMEVLIRTDSIGHTWRMAEHYGNLAKKSLKEFPNSLPKEILLALADFNIARKY